MYSIGQRRKRGWKKGYRSMNMWLCTSTPSTARKVIMAGEMARGFSGKPQPVQSWHVDSGIAEMKSELQLQWRGWHNLIMTSLPCMNVRHSKVDRRGQSWKGESRVKFVDSEGRWEHCTFPSWSVFRESFWNVNAAGRSQPCEIAFDHLIIICKLYVDDIHSFVFPCFYNMQIICRCSREEGY